MELRPGRVWVLATSFPGITELPWREGLRPSFWSDGRWDWDNRKGACAAHVRLPVPSSCDLCLQVSPQTWPPHPPAPQYPVGGLHVAAALSGPVQEPRAAQVSWDGEGAAEEQLCGDCRNGTRGAVTEGGRCEAQEPNRRDVAGAEPMGRGGCVRVRGGVRTPGNLGEPKNGSQGWAGLGRGASGALAPSRVSPRL